MKEEILTGESYISIDQGVNTMGKRFLIFPLIIIICIISIIFLMGRNIFFESGFEAEVSDIPDFTSSMPLYDMSGACDRFAVIKNDASLNTDSFDDTTFAALLINNTDNEPIVAYNTFRRIYPASTTKLLTALVVCDAIEKGRISLSDEVTLDHNVVLSVEVAVASNLHKGCTITVRNLLFGLMIRSYNDYAVILAEYVGGNEENFVRMMNDKAADIGATASHFVNPHGLHDDDHYTTAYDMYLIINKAAEYEILQEIDSYTTFSYTYLESDGTEKQDDISPTNMFLAGSYELPSNIHIKEWKTGTTRLAGSVLTMITEIDGKEYTMFIADSDGPSDLYEKFTLMFNLTTNQ